MVSNNLLRRIPATIGKLVNLQTLDLEENHLESLPPEIENLSQVAYSLLLHLAQHIIFIIPASKQLIFERLFFCICSD